LTRLHIPASLRWGDLDAYGHVNNVTMLRLVEEARIRAFWRASVDADEIPIPTALLELDANSELLSLVARTEIEYLAPMPYTSAPIDVELWIGRLGGASIDICLELFSPPGASERVLYARAATTMVTVDAESGRPKRIPDHLREGWAPYTDEPLVFTRR
jgi:acyl-CoA thioester hydrolase